MMLAMLSAVAGMERDLLVERTHAGLARAKAEGKTLSRIPKTTPTTRSNRGRACSERNSERLRTAVRHQPRNCSEYPCIVFYQTRYSATSEGPLGREKANLRIAIPPYTASKRFFAAGKKRNFSELLETRTPVGPWVLRAAGPCLQVNNTLRTEPLRTTAVGSEARQVRLMLSIAFTRYKCED
jgi:hypothetical protein